MATDITISHYSAGTATVAANGTTVTGQGTAWTGALRPGDLFGTHRGLPIRILSISSNTSLTLAHPWPGPVQTAAPYEIQHTPRDIGYRRAIEELIADVSEGNLPLLAALLGAPDKLAYFDSSNSMALADFPAWARALFGLHGEADKLPYLSGANAGSLADLTALGRSLLASASPAALWAAAGLSDGYVARTGNQTIAGTKTFTGVLVANGLDRIELPGVGDHADLVMAYNSGGNLGFWDRRDAQWRFLIQPSGRVHVNHIPHMVGSAGIGWVRIMNDDTDSEGGSGGSIRLWSGGEFQYSHAGVSRVTIQTNGNMSVDGSLTAASKSFLIDHPLDPFNKDLVFAATESPGLFVEFTGRATLVDGRALVDIDVAAGMMPGTWDALATDNLIKALINETSFARLRPGPVVDSKFEIICEDETGTDTVVWTVIGRRRDPFVMDPDNAMTDGSGRLIVEPEKPQYDPKMEDEVDAH